MIALSLLGVILLVGTLDGIFDGLTGASGGILNVPILTLLGVPIKAAIGTSLAVDVIGDIVVAYTYNESQNVDIKFGVPLTLGVVFGAQIGSALGSALPSVSLESVYILFLFLSGVVFWKSKGNIQQLAAYKKLNLAASDWLRLGSFIPRTVISIFIGVAIGSVIVLLGGGGGMLILFILQIVFGFPINKAVGTSVMVEIGSSLSGCLGYAMRGHINWLYGVILMIGIVVGGRLTAKSVNEINEKTFSKLVGTIQIALGIGMLFLSFSSTVK